MTLYLKGHQKYDRSKLKLLFSFRDFEVVVVFLMLLVMQYLTIISLISVGTTLIYFRQFSHAYALIWVPTFISFWSSNKVVTRD